MQLTLPAKLSLPRKYRYIDFSHLVAQPKSQLHAGDIIAWCDEYKQPLRTPCDAYFETYNEHSFSLLCNTDTAINPHFSSIPETQWHDRKLILTRIRNANILGMGGACFPTANKLALEPKHLIINAVECEPGVQNDKYLITHHTKELVKGINILQALLPNSHIHLAHKKNYKPPKPLINQVANSILVQQAYPAGSERNIVNILKKERLFKNHPGYVACINTTSLWAIYRAVFEGYTSFLRPLTLQYYNKPVRLVWALIGTSIEEVLAQTKTNYNPKEDLIITNGLMMGQQVDEASSTVITPSTLAIFVQKQKQKISYPCIQCGRCADACPENLLPQDIYAMLRVDKHHPQLSSCIMCGMCDFVCPSNLPLVQQFILGKQQLNNQNAAISKANAAALRHQEKLSRTKNAKKQLDAARKRARAELDTNSKKISPTNTQGPAYQREHLQKMLDKAIKKGANAETIATLKKQLISK